MGEASGQRNKRRTNSGGDSGGEAGHDGDECIRTVEDVGGIEDSMEEGQDAGNGGGRRISCF